MNRLIRLSRLLCLFVASSASVGRAQDNEFWKEFQPAIRLADLDTMVKATRRLTVQAVETYLIKLDQKLALTEVPEELETEIRYLKDAWKRAVGDDLFHNYERLLSGMTPEQRVARVKATLDLRNESFQKLKRLLATPDPAAYPALLKEFAERTKALEDLGDHYWASEGYFWYGRAMDESRKSDAGGTIEEALALFQKSKAMRKAFGVSDSFLRDCDAEIAKLEKENTPDPAGGTPGEAAGPKFAAGSKWIQIDLKLAPIEKPESITWPGHLSDDRITDWIAYSANAVGARSSPGIGWFGSAEGKKPVVLREGATKFLFDMDDDGKYDGEFKMAGKPALVEVQRKIGDATQPYWFWVGFGSSQETVQGLGMNMAPTEKLAVMFFRAGLSRVGKLVHAESGLDLDVAFYDENISGSIGDDRSFNLSGTKRGDATIPCFLYDAMTIGKSRRAVPYSSLIVLDGKVFRVKFSDEKQERVVIRQIEMKTGMAHVEVDGLKIPLASYIVEGDGDAKGAYFDLAAEKKGVELPVGKYKLAIATFRTGKSAQIQKLAAINGELPILEVKAGETAVVKIGKPFTFDFEAQDKGSSIEIPGNSVVVKGGAGELYYRFQGLMIQPDVNSRKKGTTTKPGKGETMRLCDNEGLDKGGQEAAWHPMNLVLEKPGGKGELEIHLSQKGHKWFGNIDSAWKEAK